VPTVFLSHAAADKPLVDDLKQMIQSAVGLGPGEFFYSSDKASGIPAGSGFVEYIRTKMQDATFVVSVITPAFRESEFCLAELGAVWVAADKDEWSRANSIHRDWIDTLPADTRVNAWAPRIAHNLSAQREQAQQ
jgi:TIR domain